MKTTTSLAIPSMQSVQPKPRKTEILNAMVARAKVAHDAENERRKIARNKLKAKIDAVSMKAIKGHEASVSIYCYDDEERGHVDVTFARIKTPELTSLLAQYRELRFLHWDEKETRAAINAQLTGMSRPSPTRLLEDPQAVKAIDEMLKQWGI